MEIQEILNKCDHTILTQTATWEQVRSVCDEAINFHCASVCLPASYVRRAAAYAEGRIPICTVIGFPNGYDTSAAKCFMASDAVQGGAAEVDMVINLGWVKDQKWDAVLSEIRYVKEAVEGRILKVIVETCFLTEEEKIRLCELVTESGADFIKTSTGFASGGATREDVALFARHIGPHVRIKAAGGIQTLEDAEEFIKLGASRLGSSRLVKLARPLLAETV